MAVILPTEIVKAEYISPQNLIIFSKPKVGKTTLLSKLDNCLIIDLEKGSNYVNALKYQINDINELFELMNAIKTAGNPYKYIAVDTITALEEMCIPYAETLYSKSAMGGKWFTEGKSKYGNILNLANGAGYPWLRTAFEKVLNGIKTLAPYVIFVGHVKDTILDKNGVDVNSLELDLTGKIKRITAANSDAIGYLYRKGNTNILSFKTTDEISCGARPEHLRNKEIILSEINQETGEIKTNWNQIYVN